VIWLILIAALTAIPAGAREKQHVAQRFEVTGTLQPDGSLEVVEIAAFRFTGGAYTAVTRELRAAESDGIDVLEAGMDGRVLPRGDDEGQVEVDGGSRRVRIAWHFAPALDQVHLFTLRYRYRGVIRQGEGEDWFRWPPFPTRFDYPIEDGTARLIWPASARLRRQSQVEGPSSSVSILDNGVEVRVANYREADDDVRFTARFEPGAFPAVEPQWQRDAARAQKMAPAFIAGAVMIAAATALALWLFFLRYRRDGVEWRTKEAVSAPPDTLPPALAGSIARGRVSVSWQQVLAAAFDLARRGALGIEEKPGGMLGRRKFVIRRGREGELRPHERAVMDALFTSGASEDRFDRALSRAGRRARRIGNAITSELEAERFIDRDRAEGAKALTISGIVVILLGIGIAIVLAATGMRLGEASIAVPLALAFSGLAMVISASAFSTLTPAGLRVAGRWAAYRKHLKQDIRERRIPGDGEAIGRLLPFAAALGLLPAFGKALQKIEVSHLPAWLRTLDAAGGGSAAMVAVIMAGSRSASHGSSGAARGGGVGAGGSSGAR